MAGHTKGKQINITLPPQVIDMIDDLCKVGLYGDKPSVVARNLIQDALKVAVANNLIRIKNSE